jgi:O-antigen/teichoic acid export membrane protein
MSLDSINDKRKNLSTDGLHHPAGGDSLKKRYFFKLLTNFVGIIIYVISQAIIPRGLGPKAYGDFNFLSNFFNQIVGFLDMGTSVGFYTKLSQRQKEFGLISFYLYFTGIISLCVIGFVLCMFSTPIHSWLWPAQEMLYIYMAALWGILTWVAQVFNKMADAYGVTVSTEIVRILQKVLGMILIIFLYYFNYLNLINFFYYHYIILFFLCIAFIYVLENKGYSMKQGWTLSLIQIKGYIREFYHYSHPLFSFAIVALIGGIFDRWLLQMYGGSIQQGFYSLSYQIGTACFLFTSAMTPLFMREMSIAYGNEDFAQMAYLFRRHVPLLYSIAAYFSCFVVVQADKVIYIFGGNKYKDAATAVAIMAFFPIHQTYGQLSGSIFYATERTALYRNIGIIFILIGIPVTYFLIASKEKWGIDAGATGLAIKMVLLQFVGVNVYLYFNAKFLKLPFFKYITHQIVSVTCLLAIAGIATIGVDTITGLHVNIILRFLLAGCVYSILVAVLIFYIPEIFGAKKQDIHLVRQWLNAKYRANCP